MHDIYPISTYGYMNSLLLIFLFFSIHSKHALQAQNAQPVEKICGMSLESPPRPIEIRQMKEVLESHSNWVAVIPYAFSREGDPQVYFDSERQWWGERSDGVAALIRMAHEAGMQVMLKPQVWLMRSWIGDFDAGNDDGWTLWEKSYEAYIVNYAHIAAREKVALFCIGTEYKLATKMRTEFWQKLITEVRKIYTGKITYAANWDEYQDVGFWADLDFIGIDAYFPLKQDDDPLMAELTAAWKPIKKQLKQLSETHTKPILLTEYGYRSVNGAAGNQWDGDGKPLNTNAQRKAYLALYDALWHEPWVVGGFAWKWHFKENAGGPDNVHYTPQGKPAMDVIKAVYRKTLE